MVNYKNGKIYKIVDNTNGNIYIGSTCEPRLCRRIWGHNGKYNQYKLGKYGYVKSFEIIKNNDYNIILVENYSCDTKDELLSRERYYIDKFECINKNIPLRKKNEWYIENKERLSKKYYYRNKFVSSWGGDKRTQNNLLCISSDVFQ